VQRRTFLARTFAGPLTLARLAYAQRDSSTFGKSRASVRFETGQIDVAGNKIFYRRCGQGPAILPVHGFPRTSLMWRFLAPKLSANHTVIYADLPAYGRSGIPASTDDHFPYSKRAMVQELVEVMAKLGFPAFTLIGHDRGGRVAYRLALDHPTRTPRRPLAATLPGICGNGIAFVAELVISFLLMSAILFASNHQVLAPYTHYFAAILAAVYIAFESPLSGMSTNPARTLGPAVYTHYWHALWIYFIAPPVGMLAAGESFLLVRQGKVPYCAKLHHHNDKRCIFCHSAKMQRPR
jgi:pimeloyl-ACP methyl ester carboxylesterase